MLCPATSPLSHLQPFLYPQSLFPDCFLFLQHSHYSFSALSEEKQKKKIDMKQILSSSRPKDKGSRWGKHEQGAQWGCTRVRKTSYHFPFKRNTSKEADRCLLAGRAAMLMLLVAQNLPTCWKSPKARGGSLAWLFLVLKIEYCRTQQMFEANLKGKVNVQLHQDHNH